MTGADIATLVDAGLAAVHGAAPISLEYFRTPMTVVDKLPDVAYDPVTDADRRTEAYIRERLTAQFPDHRVVGEELGTTGGDSPITWIIDPIDGTRSFISGTPMWGTLLGLVIDGEPVAGIMHQPFTGETFVADPAQGARLLHHGRSRTLTTRTSATIADAVLYSTHPYHLEQAHALSRFQALASRCRLQRWGGDCYSFCLLALGTIDLVVDGMLMPYDIAPLIPIVERAGGVVSDLDGRRPVDGAPVVVASAHERLHHEVLEVLNTAG